MPKPKCCPTHIKNLFIANEHGGESLPQCVICMKTLSNSTMKPSLLKLHLATNHVKEKEQDESYFQQLGENAKRQCLDKSGVIFQKEKGIVKALYEVTLLVAKSMKALAMGKSLVMSAAKILVKNVIGVEATAKLKTASLSNNMVKNLIEEMPIDIADQVISSVKDSKHGFSMQLDKSTDTTNNAQLLIYTRYTTQNYDAETELLMNKELSSTTKGKDAFEVLYNFFKQNEIDWEKLICCTIDGAPSMLGRKSGFTTFMETVSSNVTIIHCFIHRFALCAKMLPEKMLLCLKRVIKLVNFVKRSAVNAQLF